MLNHLYQLAPDDVGQLLFYLFLYSFGQLYAYWGFCHRCPFPDETFGKSYNFYFYMSFIWPVLAVWGMWQLHKKDIP